MHITAAHMRTRMKTLLYKYAYTKKNYWQSWIVVDSDSWPFTPSTTTTLACESWWSFRLALPFCSKAPAEWRSTFLGHSVTSGHKGPIVAHMGWAHPYPKISHVDNFFLGGALRCMKLSAVSMVKEWFLGVLVDALNTPNWTVYKLSRVKWACRSCLQRFQSEETGNIENKHI